MTIIDHQLQRASIAIGIDGDTPYLGEDITQFEHGQQAAFFAEQQGHSEDVMLAGLLHDIGHYAYRTVQPQMGVYGAINHEWIGARLAKELGFSNKIARLIGYHVATKRYLAGKRPGYLQLLSAASLQTLIHQGGPLNSSEIAEFEALANFSEILQVRTNDEKGKVVDLDMPAFSYYQQRMVDYLTRQQLTSHNTPQITLLNAEHASDYLAISTPEHYDLVLCIPLPQLLPACQQHFSSVDSLVMPDYFFCAGLPSEILAQLGIQFDEPVSSINEYIEEFLELVTLGCRQNYLLIVHPIWFAQWQVYLAEQPASELSIIKHAAEALSFNLVCDASAAKYSSDESDSLLTALR